MSISIIPHTVGTETLSVGIYYLSAYETGPLTATLSVVQSVFILLCVFLFRRLVR